MGAGAETVAHDPSSAARHAGVGILCLTSTFCPGGGPEDSPKTRLSRSTCRLTSRDCDDCVCFPRRSGGQWSVVDPFEAGLVGVD